MSEKGITNVEAQRIVQILNELATKLFHVSMVDSAFVEKLKSDDNEKLLSDLNKVDEKIERHLALEEDFKLHLGDGNLATLLEDDQSGLKPICDSMQRSLRDICRELSRKTLELTQLRGLGANDNRASQIDTFREIIGSITNETKKRLSQTVEGDMLLQEQLKGVEEQLTARRERLKVLQADLDKLTEVQGSAKNAREHILARLRDDKCSLEESTRNHLETLKSASATKIQTEEEMFRKKRAALQERIDRLKAENAELRTQMLASENELRANKRNKEDTIANKLQAYDQQMTAQFYKERALEHEIQMNRTELGEVERRLVRVRAEMQRKEQERRLEQERENLVEGKKVERNIAASHLQAFWRAFTERQNYSGLIKKQKLKERKNRKKVKRPKKA